MISILHHVEVKTSMIFLFYHQYLYHDLTLMSVDEYLSSRLVRLNVDYLTNHVVVQNVTKILVYCQVYFDHVLNQAIV